MRRCLLVFVGCVGCAHGATPIANDGATAPKPTPCLPDRELEAFARTIWEAGTRDVTSLLCIPIRRGATSLWWIEGQVDFKGGPDEYGDHPWVHSLVDADKRTVVWNRRDKPIPFGKEHYDRGTADFDGDGNDEIWMVETMGEGGASATSFVVIDIAKDPVTMEFRLGWMNDAGEHECFGHHEVVRRGARYVIEVRRDGAACTAEDKAHEVVERRGNELVPVK